MFFPVCSTVESEEEGEVSFSGETGRSPPPPPLSPPKPAPSPNSPSLPSPPVSQPAMPHFCSPPSSLPPSLPHCSGKKALLLLLLLLPIHTGRRRRRRRREGRRKYVVLQGAEFPHLPLAFISQEGVSVNPGEYYLAGALLTHKSSQNRENNPKRFGKTAILALTSRRAAHRAIPRRRRHGNSNKKPLCRPSPRPLVSLTVLERERGKKFKHCPPPPPFPCPRWPETIWPEGGKGEERRRLPHVSGPQWTPSSSLSPFPILLFAPPPKRKGGWDGFG